MSLPPIIASMTVATAVLTMQWAHGYSGCSGVTSIGSHDGIRSVSGLPSMSPLRIAVIGRQIHNDATPSVRDTVSRLRPFQRATTSRNREKCNGTALLFHVADVIDTDD